MAALAGQRPEDLKLRPTEAWLFLGKALLDGGLGLQTGWIGWSAVWRGRRLQFPPLAQVKGQIQQQLQQQKLQVYVDDLRKKAKVD